jgi:hypothetical protein
MPVPAGCFDTRNVHFNTTNRAKSQVTQQQQQQQQQTTLSDAQQPTTLCWMQPRDITNIP